MKTIIAGSRDISDINVVAAAVELSGFSGQITEVVSGMARGVDLLGKQWAKTWNIPVTEFPADWTRYGNRAGFMRNEAMAEYADALIAIWDGRSRGTLHMITTARAGSLKVFVYYRNTALADF